MKTKEEIEILIADATSGDANAQNTLGCVYGAGDGVVKDYAKALDWFRKSADQRNIYACFNVGLYNELGRGIKKDIYEAITWYTKAYELGLGKGALALGRLHENGYKPSIVELSQGVKSLTSNPEDAFYWYQRATTEEEGRFNLARCYELGIGTLINLRKAVAIYRNLKLPQAQERLLKLLEKYNPEEETRLRTLSLFSQNPNRIIGIYANASSREIKANIAKIEAYRKVEKTLSLPLDELLPCTIAARTLFYTDSLRNLHAELNNVGSNGIKSNSTWEKNRIEYLIKSQETKLKDIIRVSQGHVDWNEMVCRSSESLSRAISDIEDEKSRILNALFWFHCHTDEDKIAFNLIQQGKWEEAISIWKNSDSYSAYINMAVLEWYKREDSFAIQDLLTMIRDDEKRLDFLSGINIQTESYSETDIKRILWDGLFSEFSPIERVIDWHNLGAELEYTILTDCGFDEDDNLHIINKAYQEIATPLIELLQKAKSWSGNDFEVGQRAHDKLYREGKLIIKRIERLIGTSDPRYIRACDEVALELLEYGISHNNNCKDWGAPSIALYMAQWAENLAVSELLKNRCQKNVKIFKENKRVATTDKILETIDEKFSIEEKKTPSYEVVDTMIKDADLHLVCLKTEIGTDSPLFIKVSSSLVNRILNVLIKVYNSQDKTLSEGKTLSLIEKVQPFIMDQETRARLNKNKDIIGRNRRAFECNGNNPSSYRRSGYKSILEQLDDMKKSLQNPEDSHTTKRIRKAKGLLTCVYIFAIAGLIAYLCIIGGWFIENHPWWPLVIGLDIFVLFSCILASWEAESANENGKFRRPFSWGCEAEIKDRRKHKLWISIITIAMIGLLYRYLSWGNNYSYFWETQSWWICICVALMCLCNLFIIAMWFLEVQRDPKYMDVFTFDLDDVDRSTGVKNAGCLLLIPFLPYYFIMIPFKLATLIR